MNEQNGGTVSEGYSPGSRPTRPIIPWVVAIVLAIAAILAICYSSGFGRLPAELRDLLAHSAEHPRAINDAMRLLLLAEEEQPGRRCELLAVLLDDGDSQVIGGTLTLVADQFRYAAGEERTDLERVFAGWFDGASIADKVAHLPQTLACACPDAWIITLKPADRRWLIAATLTRVDDLRLVADRAAFGPEADENPICRRLRYLDGLADEYGTVDATVDLSMQLAGQLPLSHAELATMLRDQLTDVRYAAGRLLSVGGDERGLPVFAEWLQTRPPSLDAGERLMRALYGADWRSRAGGDTARQ